MTARGVTLPTALQILENLKKPNNLRKFNCYPGGSSGSDDDPDEPDTGEGREEPRGFGRPQGGRASKKGKKPRGATQQQKQKCLRSHVTSGASQVRFHILFS